MHNSLSYSDNNFPVWNIYVQTNFIISAADSTICVRLLELVVQTTMLELNCVLKIGFDYWGNEIEVASHERIPHIHIHLRQHHRFGFLRCYLPFRSIFKCAIDRQIECSFASLSKTCIYLNMYLVQFGWFNVIVTHINQSTSLFALIMMRKMREWRWRGKMFANDAVIVKCIAFCAQKESATRISKEKKTKLSYRFT